MLQHLFLDEPGVGIAGKFDAEILPVFFENAFQHSKGSSFEFPPVKLSGKAKQRHYILIKPAKFEGCGTLCIDTVFDRVVGIVQFSIEPALRSEDAQGNIQVALICLEAGGQFSHICRFVLQQMCQNAPFKQGIGGGRCRYPVQMAEYSRAEVSFVLFCQRHKGYVPALNITRVT